MTSNKLRQKFIDRYSEFVFDEIDKVIRGEAELKTKSEDLFFEVFYILKDVIKKAGDVQEIQARSTNDVIRALMAGKATPKETLQLIKVLKVKVEVDQLTTKLKTEKQLLRMIK